ncbi:MAG: C25 family cysteine peptidase [Crocinitomicaceae bacterium]|nr:C25 family cysteine peptidase [Crocinitomicaceae bacterium]
MKNITKIFFIGFLSLAFNSIIAQQKPKLLSFVQSNVLQTYEAPKRTLTSTDNNVLLTYETPNCLVSNKSVKGVNYQFLTIKNFDYTDKVGFPAIPAHIDIIALPYDAQPKIQIVSAEYIEYSGYYLHPILSLASDEIGAPEPSFEINVAQYNKDEFYPSKLVEVVELQKICGTPLAFTQIHPVQFNPVSKKIRVYSKITYRVDFVGSNRTFSEISSNINQGSLNVLNNVAINNASIPKTIQKKSNSQLKNSGNSDYIIFTHPNFINASKALAKWKMQLGYKVEILSNSSWTSSQIKDSLHAKYNTYTPKPSFVLFMGDIDKVPGELINNEFVSDLYYVCMDGSGDYVADMARGRIAAASPSDAMIAVNKIINYEKNPVADPTFYQTGLNCAEFQDNDDNGYADRRFSLTSENIFDHLTTNYGFTIDRVYGSNSTNPTNWNNGSYAAGEPVPSYLLKPGFPWDGTGNDVQSKMNLGQLYVLHRDHGYSQGWGTPGFNTSHIPGLTNGNRLPVMFSINCSSGDLDDPTSFAKQLIRHPNGGAVGVFAASDISYSGLNDAFVLGLFDAIWDSPGITPNFTGSGGTGNPPPAHSTIVTLGDVLNHGLLAMAATWNSHERTNQLFHYHGDPAMKIWKELPTQITASSISQIQCGDTLVSISSSSCLDGLATVYFNNQLLGSVQLVNGSGVISIPPITNIDPFIVLTISKTNHQPFVMNIPIVNCTISPQAIFDISSTKEALCGGTTDTVIFTDLSYYAPNQWEWNFSPSSITYVNGTNSNSPNPEVIFNAPGFYSVQQIATNAHGSDTLISFNIIQVTSGSILPLMEDFEAGVFPPQDWTINNPDNAKTWEGYSGLIGNGSSMEAARLNFYAYNSNGQIDELISPKLDFTNTPNPMLEFKISHVQFSNYVDHLKVLISTDCGATFQTVYHESGSNLVTSSNSTSSSWAPSLPNDWRKELIDLSSYQGNTVIIKFQGITGYGNNLYLDDINIFSGNLAPQTDFVASETELYCQPAIIFFTDLSQYNASNHSWSFTPNTITYLNGTSAYSINPEVKLDANGMYQVSLTTSNANGSDTETKNAYVQYVGGHVLPLMEGFESNSGIPSEWEIENPDNNKTWEWNNTTSGNGTSAASIYMNYWSYGAGEKDAVISPQIDLSSASNAHLSFNIAYAQYNQHTDSLLVSVSTDCGSSYDSAIYIKGGVDLVTANISGAFTPSNSNEWRQEVLDLSSYLGNEIKIKFEGISDYGNNLYLDDINVYYNSAASVLENAESLSVEAIPNPSNGLVHLIVNNSSDTPMHYQLTDIKGKKLIDNHPIISDKTEIDLSLFPAGIYFITVADYTRSKVIKIIRN